MRILAVVALCGLLLLDLAVLSPSGDVGSRSILDYTAQSHAVITRSTFGRLSRRYVADWTRLALDPTNPLRLSAEVHGMVASQVPILIEAIRRELWLGRLLLATLSAEQKTRLAQTTRQRLSRANLYRLHWTELGDRLSEAFVGTIAVRPPSCPAAWRPDSNTPEIQRNWDRRLGRHDESDPILEAFDKTMIASLIADRKEGIVSREQAPVELGQARALVDCMTDLAGQWDKFSQLLMEVDSPQTKALRENEPSDDIRLEDLAEALEAASRSR